ncbi:MAG TPA: glycosyltransferase family 4 protein [Clostridiales bacterium]|nr:glycosyltransferase family 4 protein [Clostridiales bacterium]
MKRVLMVASVASMIDQFNMDNIGILQGLGYEVYVAANFLNGNTSSKQRLNEFIQELEARGVMHHQIDFARSVTHLLSNYKAYKQLRRLIQSMDFQFIHCHSPIGGVCARLLAHKNRVKVIYTAHGFHFYKGASPMKWLLYYPVERWLSRYTDVLITVNEEDYVIAQSLHAKEVVKIPGIGIDLKSYENVAVDIGGKKRELGIPEGSFIVLSVGELSKRKNHEIVIKALAESKLSNVIYLICGLGDKEEYLRGLASSLGVDVKFLGYRSDIRDIYKVADLFVFPSLQEGLPVALMEAMAVGTPVICSDIRGNRDLIDERIGEQRLNPRDDKGFSNAISNLYSDKMMRKSKAVYNRMKIKGFSKDKVNDIMTEIYTNLR